MCWPVLADDAEAAASNINLNYHRPLITIKLSLASIVALAGIITAQLQQVTNFSSNLSGAKMYVYIPNNLPANPAVIVAIYHY